jgi:hypothetical protein
LGWVIFRLLFTNKNTKHILTKLDQHGQGQLLWTLKIWMYKHIRAEKAIGKSEPEQHELTKAQRKNKQRAETRRPKREGLLPKPCEAVPTAARPSVHTIQTASCVNRRVGPVEARAMILPNDIDLVMPLVFRQEKKMKLVGARRLARRFSVSWNTFCFLWGWRLLLVGRYVSTGLLQQPLASLSFTTSTKG